MNFFPVFAMIAALAVLSLAVYMIFKKFFLGKENAGMKFLLTNITKDVLWSILWLTKMQKSRASFLIFLCAFSVINFLLYFSVIKKLNRR